MKTLNSTERIFLKKLGQRIAHLRLDRKKWTQEKFAEEFGIDRSALARIESGGINSSIVKLQQIATLLGVSLSELFDFK